MRKPDLIVGPSAAPTYYRWQLFKIRGFQLCLHKWLRSDDDRALHDHSGNSISMIIRGAYLEIFADDASRIVLPFRPVFRKAETPHRVVLVKTWHGNGGRHSHEQRPVWSLWFRWPPRREWGFHCPKGWRHWKDYLNSRGDYYAAGSSETGPGCN